MNYFAQILAADEPVRMEALVSFVSHSECGAIVTFAGTVRNTENGQPLIALNYEHHEQMALVEVEKILVEALSRFTVLRTACVHRTGSVLAGEASVAVAVGAGHRGAAFEACEFIMDKLKLTVPIWKSPIYSNNQEVSKG